MIAHAPSIAREISKTDHIVGLISVQVGSYECKDKPRSCRIRYSEIIVTLLAEVTGQSSAKVANGVHGQTTDTKYGNHL